MITRKCDCGSGSFEIEQTFDWKHLWCKSCGLGVSLANKYKTHTCQMGDPWDFDFTVDHLVRMWNNKHGVYKLFGRP